MKKYLVTVNKVIFPYNAPDIVEEIELPPNARVLTRVDFDNAAERWLERRLTQGNGSFMLRISELGDELFGGE